MPSRIIREGYLDSEAYAQVDDLAKLVWHHMLSLADDFGCISLAPTFVRRRLFYNHPSDATVSRVIEQLMDAGLIRVYSHDDGRYAFIPKFRQRLQRRSIKHPIPPESLWADDEHAAELFKEIKAETKNPTVAPPLPNGSTTGPQPPEVKRREEKRRTDSLSGKPDPAPKNSANETAAREVLGVLNRATGSNYQAVDSNLRLVMARLSEFDVKTVKRVIAMKADEWRDDPKMADYLRPKTLFNATNFANYAGRLPRDEEVS